MTDKRKAAPARAASKTIHTLDNTPFRGIHAYERLRRDFIATNPKASELETLQACVQFAGVCGLVIKRVILELQHAGLRGAE